MSQLVNKHENNYLPATHHTSVHSDVLRHSSTPSIASPVPQPGEPFGKIPGRETGFIEKGLQIPRPQQTNIKNTYTNTPINYNGIPNVGKPSPSPLNTPLNNRPFVPQLLEAEFCHSP